MNQSKLQESYDFYPNEETYWLEYLVDSIYIDMDIPRRDTFHFYIKEVIGEQFEDNEGRLTQRLIRYRKDSLSGTYELKNIWAFNKLKRSVEKIEDNLRFIKLTFPIDIKTTWQGNNYIHTELDHEFYKDWTYRYIDVYQSKEVLGVSYDSTITVDQEDNMTDHFWHYGREVYAYKIGMIEKLLYNIESDETLGSENMWLEHAERGTILKYQLLNYKR